jgi:hypothetical protein
MSTKIWIVVGAIALGGLWYARRSAPDERIAQRMEMICEIADSNVRSPSRGVDALFGFFGARSPELFRDFGDLLVEIERIDNDAKHDARARTARERMRKPLEACQSSLIRFGQAIEGDRKASEKLNRGMNRLGRTLGILFDERSLGDALAPLHLR